MVDKYIWELVDADGNEYCDDTGTVVIFNTEEEALQYKQENELDEFEPIRIHIIG